MNIHKWQKKHRRNKVNKGNPCLNAEQEELLSLWEKLTPEQRKSIMKFIESFKA